MNCSLSAQSIVEPKIKLIAKDKPETKQMNVLIQHVLKVFEIVHMLFVMSNHLDQSLDQKTLSNPLRSRKIELIT